MADPITKPKAAQGDVYVPYEQDTYVSDSWTGPRLVPEGEGRMFDDNRIYDKDLVEGRSLTVDEAGNTIKAPPQYPFPIEKKNFTLTEEGKSSVQEGLPPSFNAYMEPIKASIRAKEEASKPPSLQNYLQYATDSALNNASAAATRFPEESDPSLSQALEKADPLRRQVETIGNLGPEERANTGALIGARAGATFMGRQGATLGGRIGAFVGRGAGVAKSGELAKQTRDSRIWNSMKTMGVVSPEGKVKFEDSAVTLPADAVGRLPNLKANPLNGLKDRTLYETDPTNPLTQRALLAAKPLAMYYANGMLGYKDKKNPVDAEAAKVTSAMYANMFTEGVSSADTVYSRARQTAKKMGLKEKQVRGYFSTISADLSFEEAQDIKKGLDILFAK